MANFSFHFLVFFLFVSSSFKAFSLTHFLLLPSSLSSFSAGFYYFFFFFFFFFFQLLTYSERGACNQSRAVKKLATRVEGDPKVPFSIATTQGVREGATPFPGLLHFTLDPYLIMLSVMQGGIKYHFWVFGMTRLRIEPRSPGFLVNTLTIMPLPYTSV